MSASFVLEMRCLRNWPRSTADSVALASSLSSSLLRMEPYALEASCADIEYQLFRLGVAVRLFNDTHVVRVSSPTDVGAQRAIEHTWPSVVLSSWVQGGGDAFTPLSERTHEYMIERTLEPWTLLVARAAVSQPHLLPIRCFSALVSQSLKMATEPQGGGRSLACHARLGRWLAGVIATSHLSDVDARQRAIAALHPLRLLFLSRLAERDANREPGCLLCGQRLSDDALTCPCERD